MKDKYEGLTEDQKAFELLSPEAKAEKIRQAHEDAEDWYGWCKKCGHKIVGKLALFRGACPKCGFK